MRHRHPEARRIRAAQREDVQRLLDKIAATAPPWAGKPPWEVEELLERGIKRQRELFERTEANR
jgi:hypothetical protein